MLNVNRSSYDPSEAAPSRRRRVLVCDATEAGATFASRLLQGGYETMLATADRVPQAIRDFAPHLVAIELRGNSRDGDALSLARDLRADAVTTTLPYILVYGGVRSQHEQDTQAAREAALSLGADDCFAISTPTAEALARIDSIFWRVEAWRDLASAAADEAARARRAEIDGFIGLLDAARAANEGGEGYTLALIAAVGHENGTRAEKGGARDVPRAQGVPYDDSPGASAAQPRHDDQVPDAEQPLRAAHAFFKLNLRRADALAFYGPELLAALLPRRRPRSAFDDLTRLHAELTEACPEARVAVGLASFPEDGAEVEELIEKAEAALALAQADRAARVVAHGARELAVEPVESVPFESRFVERSDDSGIEAAKFTVGTDGGSGRTAALENSPDGGTAREGSSLNSRVADNFRREPDAAQAHAARVAQEESRPVAAHDLLPSERERAMASEARRAVRESRRGEAYETAVLMPSPGASQVEATGALTQEAAEAALRERDRRSRGAIMPRRVLLTVSDPARMAQINLLLRSASYEVRAAFDGRQALDLLRIERADLLVLDYELKQLDGLEVLRRLRERNPRRLPMPILLMHPPATVGERVREEARTLGATGFVPLPYDPTLLLDTVRETGNKD